MDDLRDAESEAIVRGLHDRGACRRETDPAACDMKNCGAAWFLREAVKAGIKLEREGTGRLRELCRAQDRYLKSVRQSLTTIADHLGTYVDDDLTKAMDGVYGPGE